MSFVIKGNEVVGLQRERFYKLKEVFLLVTISSVSSLFLPIVFLESNVFSASQYGKTTSTLNSTSDTTYITPQDDLTTRPAANPTTIAPNIQKNALFFDLGKATSYLIRSGVLIFYLIVQYLLDYQNLLPFLNP